MILKEFFHSGGLTKTNTKFVKPYFGVFVYIHNFQIQKGFANETEHCHCHKTMEAINLFPEVTSYIPIQISLYIWNLIFN